LNVQDTGEQRVIWFLCLLEAGKASAMVRIGLGHSAWLLGALTWRKHLISPATQRGFQPGQEAGSRHEGKCCVQAGYLAGDRSLDLSTNDTETPVPSTATSSFVWCSALVPLPQQTHPAHSGTDRHTGKKKNRKTQRKVFAERYKMRHRPHRLWSIVSCRPFDH